jgi:ABC-type multidrug transport system ATPase subunit
MRLGGSVAAGFNLLFNKARAATRRLQQLGITVGEFEEEGSLVAGETLDRGWARLELAGVMHSYRNTFGVLEDDDDADDDAADDLNADPTESRAAANEADVDAATELPSREGEDNNFVLGPLDLTLRAGEITFVVGGNGSGKSTLLKLLSGLYYPESGEIRLDGQTIDVRRREAYRQLFSGLFDEAVLFENLWGIAPDQVDAGARRYLQALHLDREVTIADGKFSTTETLSKGQRKRLALVAAYLEDRPIYVFDEWAANQDPLFKGVFYRQILPELKSRGRTVVAVTHDDNYFDVADRIVILRDGKVVEGSWQEHLAQRGSTIEAIAQGLNGKAVAPAANEAKAGAG